MADEEARKRIMAEYMASIENDPSDNEPLASDDDEDLEDDDGEEAPFVLLHGDLLAKDGVLLWKGRWKLAGDTESMEFQLSCPLPSEGNGTHPPSGLQWEGFFVMKSDKEEGGKSKIEEKEVTLQFTPGGDADSNYTVSGTGCNDLGRFTINGTYKPSDRHLVCEKRYVQAEEEDDGEEEEEDEEEEDEDEDEEEGHQTESKAAASSSSSSSSLSSSSSSSSSSSILVCSSKRSKDANNESSSSSKKPKRNE
jgi:hypothetical protein